MSRYYALIKQELEQKRINVQAAILEHEHSAVLLFNVSVDAVDEVRIAFR